METVIVSKKNILSTERLPNGRVRVTFDTDSGHMVYEYHGQSARALNKGTDPSQLMGKLVEHKKAEDEKS
jgi:hypothetical protein